MFRNAGVYALLVALAVLLNAAGYLLSLWHEETAFDEAAHLFTSFAGMAALGRIAAATPAFGRSAPPLWVFIGVGLLLGIAWEGLEWLLGIIGSLRDTLIDLVMDGTGAAAAAALLRWACPAAAAVRS